MLDFLKNLFQRKKEEPPSYLIDFLYVILDNPDSFDTQLITEKDYLDKYYHYLVLKNKNKPKQIIKFLIGTSKTTKLSLDLKDAFTKIIIEPPNLVFANVSLKDEIKEKLYDTYLYPFCAEAKLQEFKADILFGLKDD